MAPIRREWRHWYRGKEWEAARNGELRRAGGRFDEKGKYIGGAKCRQCGKPDRELVETVTYKDFVGDPVMLWRTLGSVGSGWRTWRSADVPMYRAGEPVRVILVKIGVAHLDHNPANRFEYNLRALCQWCHLHHDAPHHRETRAERKDAARPLLEAAAEWGRRFEAMGEVKKP